MNPESNTLPLTPSTSSPPTSDAIPQSQPTVDFSPATVPYNESFENDLMNLLLHPPSHPHAPTPSPDTLVIPASQLPIPLSSPLRTHASPIPGLLVTHPSGYHTGGPGPSPATIDAFVVQFMHEHEVADMEEAQAIARDVMSEKTEEIRERMVERERAVGRNREVQEELEKLRLQRDAEVRVLERLKGRR